MVENCYEGEDIETIGRATSFTGHLFSTQKVYKEVEVMRTGN